ncbi:MAG: DNA polymerase III subunit delta', partial [Oscillospiraceae bacterium]|nr:DNA polymerase III subunit delta' [Oscillospiraceae bacterium]
MIKLYSKEQPAAAIDAMMKTGRLAHAFLLTGEHGVGKKVFADYIAMTLLCENGNACGQCRHCKRILANTHPDVIKPEKSGKKQIYNRETIRNICSDAFVSPNDCDAKVYIFSDCEGLEEGTQNLMLKLIEEPPDTVYFIFTAVNASVFLPTIRSRVITLGIPECSEEDCLAALMDTGSYTKAQAEDAVKRFHGNIGGCMDYIAGGETAENVEFCRKITAAIADSNEYALLAALHQIGENRNRIKAVLEMLN